MTVTGHVATEKIFVRGDGRTVCPPNDPEVAFLKYVPGQTISAAELGALIFPPVQAPAPVDTSNEPVPDAETRAEPVPDAERRRPGRPRKR